MKNPIIILLISILIVSASMFTALMFGYSRMLMVSVLLIIPIMVAFARLNLKTNENNTMNTINIQTQIPEGYEIDRENSTLDNIILKQIANKKPEWADFGEIEGYFINSLSRICKYEKNAVYDLNRHTLPTKELAEAMLALCQLINWRDKYNEGWIPDFTAPNEVKYVIFNDYSKLYKEYTYTHNRILAFKTAEIRDKFFEDFEDLITIALPLI